MEFSLELVLRNNIAQSSLTEAIFAIACGLISAIVQVWRRLLRPRRTDLLT
jgi:hypothetical protein